jgi:hypothetical protein
MNALAVWKRLLWKEVREGWPVFALAFVAPPLCFGLPLIVGRLTPHREVMAFVAAIGVPTAIALWVISDRKRSKNRWQNASASLPVPPLVEWCITILLPATGLALAGAWLGLWSGALVGWYNAPSLALTYGVFFSAFFIACCFITGAFKYLAPFSALLWGAWFNVTVQVCFGDRPQPGALETALLFNTCILAISAAASLAFSVSLRDRINLRYTAAVALAIIVMPGPYAVVMGYVARNLIVSRHEDQMGGLISADRSYWLTFDGRDVPAGYVKAVFGRPPGDSKSTRSFRRTIRAVGVVDQRFVYFARQLPDDARVSILEWDTRAGNVRTVTSFTAGKGSLVDRGIGAQTLPVMVGRFHAYTSDIFGPWGHVSPSGQYLVLKTRTAVGLGDDLWIVNLRDGRRRQALANALFPKERANWNGNKLVLSGDGNPLAIDLRSGRSQVVYGIQAPTEGRQ